MKRSVGVTVAAVLLLLGSVGWLALNVLIAISLVVLGPRLSTQQPAVNPAAMAIFYGALALVGVWGICTAIGLFRLKRWARISMLVISGLTAFGFGMPALVMPFIPMPSADRLSPEAVRTGVLVISAIFAAPALLSAWWLYFFNTAGVKTQFVGSGPSGSPRPAGITVIAVLMIIGGAMSLVMSLSGRLPAVLFGSVFKGWAATGVYVLIALVSLGIGVGLWRLHETARKAALGYLVFGALNTATSWFSPAFNAYLEESMRAASSGPSMPLEGVRAMVWVILIPTTLVFAVQLWYLCAKRSLFQRSRF